MATLDDIRTAGYNVRLAWEGDQTPDVYAISRDATQPDPTQPNYDGGSLSYLVDDSDALEAFLEAEKAAPRETSE